MLWQMPQQRLQILKRKFADRQNLLRLIASHVLMLVASLQVRRSFDNELGLVCKL